RLAFQRSFEAIISCSGSSPATRGMGTTLTACVIERSGAARIGHIGDSRMYRFREGSMTQLTHDHTWVQREVDAGRLTPTEARIHPLSHIVTRVLSEDVEPEMDLLSADVQSGDRLLLATDGLYNMVEEGALEAMLASTL